MDNPNMFDELTNRLNKVKRPDSGIHNSGEFIGDHEKLEKSEEQADSGRDSDPAEPADAADGSGAVKKGGILKSFKKMFRIRRKSKSGKVKDDENAKVISTQYKAVSEPEMNTISSSSKEPSIPRSNTGMPPKRFNDSPNANDFTSDDEELRIDEKKNSLKDAPSFIRSSLRKLKLKKKKTGGMDSTEVTPTSVKKHNVEPPPISPKKSPQKARSSSRSSHSSDQTEPRSDSFTKDLSIETDDGKSSRSDSVHSQPVAVNVKEEPLPWHPIIESSAAKDKIRVAPRGRKRPSRVRNQTKTPDITDKKPSLAQISENDDSDGVKPVENKDSFLAELSKKTVKDVSKKSTEDLSKTPVDVKQISISEVKNTNTKTAEAVDKAFDSVINSLETIRNISDLPKKSSPESKTSSSTAATPPLPKLRTKSEQSETQRRSRDSLENIPYVIRRNTDNVSSSRKSIESTKGSIENLDTSKRSLKNSVSLGDLIVGTEDASPTRRSKSFQTSNSIESSSRQNISPDVEPVKEDSAEKKRYDKYRKNRSQTNPDNHDKMKHAPFSKSVEDVSLLNKENNRRSGPIYEPLGTPYHKDVSRENSNNDTRLDISNENMRKSKESLKKSSSRHSLNETTFAITSINNQDPIIPYGDSTQVGLSNASDKPRKLQKRPISGSIDNITNKSTRKPRPQSVTIRSTDASLIFGKVSGARSYGDIRSLSDLPDPEKQKSFPPVSKKAKPLNNSGKSKSVDKPLLVTTGKSRSVDIHQVNDNVNDGDKNEPEFKRMSLRKTPKAEDYLPKETAGDVAIPGELVEENPVLTSIKTTLKHVEPKAGVDISSNADSSEHKHEENIELNKNVENKTSPNKDKQLTSSVIVESRHLPLDVACSVETRETKEKAPEFHRISLKKVEKRDDYLEKEPETTSRKEEDHLDKKADVCENKINLSEQVASTCEVTPNIPSPTEESVIREKPKPPIKAKPFQFQSHDVKNSENETQNIIEKSKPVPLSQTNKLSYFRRSVDIQENPNPHGNVPAWIAMARERQRDEATEKVIDESPKETSEKTDDVTVESLVKPSALKAKPTPLPKPAPASKAESTPLSTSPTSNSKKPPPPVSQRPSLGRFNAKTDLPKDACMVCGKTAYVLERCEVNKRTLHRSCAKCYLCSRTLNLGDIFISDDKVWCKQHR